MVAGAFGLVVSAVAVMPWIGLVYLLMPVLGAASISMISMSNATLQLNSAPALRGRVMALFSMALLGSTPIGGPIVGYLGEHVSPRFSLAVGGVAALGAAVYGWSRLEEPVPADALGQVETATA
jgi:MFS family permease